MKRYEYVMMMGGSKPSSHPTVEGLEWFTTEEEAKREMALFGIEKLTLWRRVPYETDWEFVDERVCDNS